MPWAAIPVDFSNIQRVPPTMLVPTASLPKASKVEQVGREHHLTVFSPKA